MNNKYTHYCLADENTDWESDEYGSTYRACGKAVSGCWEENGELWVGTDGGPLRSNEYESRVNFCPYCGYKAQKTIGSSAGSCEELNAEARREEAEKAAPAKEPGRVASLTALTKAIDSAFTERLDKHLNSQSSLAAFLGNK